MDKDESYVPVENESARHPMSHDRTKEESESGGPMDKVIDRFTNSIELAIRYLMTGFVVGFAVWMSCSRPDEFTEWAVEKPELTGIAALAAGFTAFIIYRLFFWIFADGLFWFFKVSAPALYRHPGPGYHAPFADFLIWRYSGVLKEQLSGYLTYRWSVVHFVIVSASVLGFASLLSAPTARVAGYAPYVEFGSVVTFVLAIWQFHFLLRVERELCRTTKKPS
jgi:hypothetical protein